MGSPAVTFIIPCFNYGRFVGDAVASCLAQRECDARVIVIDDGSDDGSTPAVCDACAGERVRVVHQTNAGPCVARNAGAAMADTPYLCFLDADDTLEPDFARLLAAALEHSGEATVSHAYCHERLTELGWGEWRVPEWDPLQLLITNLHPVTALVRTDAFRAVGGFCPEMTEGYEDWELWIRLSARGYRGVRVPEVLFNWRRHSHDTRVMRDFQRHEALYAKIVDRNREHFERHAMAMMLRTNEMLKRFECHWIDETGLPIPLKLLRKMNDDFPKIVEHCHALDREWRSAAERAASAEARAQALAGVAAELEAARAELTRARAEVLRYERSIAFRLRRQARAVVDRLPAPVARGVHAAAARLRKGPTPEARP